MMTNKKKFSSKQEKILASSLGWHVVSGSGSRNLKPGDIVSNEWLGECKTHVEPNKRIKFVYSIWNKIVDEASFVRKFPVLFVDDGSQKPSSTWCITTVLPPKPHIVMTYPFKTNSSSFSFEHSDLLALTRDLERNFGDIVIYSVKYSGKLDCYLYPFSSFLDCFGE